MKPHVLGVKACVLATFMTGILLSGPAQAGWGSVLVGEPEEVAVSEAFLPAGSEERTGSIARPAAIEDAERIKRAILLTALQAAWTQSLAVTRPVNSGAHPSTQTLGQLAFTRQ